MAFFFFFCKSTLSRTRYKHLHLLIAMLLLLYTFRLDNNVIRFKAEAGRVMSKSLQPSQAAADADALLQEEEDKMVMGSRRMVGSRPPKCERSCGSCGPCQAVQVPIAPLLQLRGHINALHTKNRTRHLHSSSSSSSSSVFPTNHNNDGISNYKPICWKCKCGNFIFNP